MLFVDSLDFLKSRQINLAHIGQHHLDTPMRGYVLRNAFSDVAISCRREGSGTELVAPASSVG